jgi:hypothetical protein
MSEERPEKVESAASAPQEKPEPSAEEREAMRRFEDEISRLTVVDHLELMLHSLSSMAVDRLGVGQGGSARKDLDQARTAIDAFRALLGVIEGKLAAEQLAGHRAALSQLQMAYVAVSAPAPAPEPEPAPATEPEATPAPAEAPEPEPGSDDDA